MRASLLLPSSDPLSVRSLCSQAFQAVELGRIQLAVAARRAALHRQREVRPRLVDIAQAEGRHRQPEVELGVVGRARSLLGEPVVRGTVVTRAQCSLAELEEKWAHAQNDALGYFLWIAAKLVAAPMSESENYQMGPAVPSAKL